MQHVRSHGFGTLTPTDSVVDVVRLLREAREWSCEVDESLRKAGCQPDGGVLGMPLAQVDVILVILDRAEAERVAVRSDRRSLAVAAACLAAVALLLGVINLIVRVR